MSLFFGLSSKLIFSRNLIYSLPRTGINAFNQRYHTLLNNSTSKECNDFRWTSPNKFFSSKEFFYTNYFRISWSPAIKINFKKFIRKILLIESTFNIKRGYQWYATLQGVDINEFILLLGMPDTFASWFKITELHVWMLLTRLMQDGPDVRKIRISVVDAMWDDALKRAKKFAPFNNSLLKDFRSFYNEFAMIVFSLDEAFLTDDKALCNVLWYYFFEKNCDDPRKLEALISYIRCQIYDLQLLNTKGISEEKISQNIWRPLKPHFI